MWILNKAMVFALTSSNQALMWVLLLLMGLGFLFHYWYNRRLSAAVHPIELRSNDLISCKYDVFISFRGTDTRNNFTAHLESALRRKKIKVYKDDVTLPRGEEISPALYEAIEDSKISIVVFSKNYATSRWCLDELVHILKCKREKGQVFLPVFYKVDPSHVRKQEESYAKAFVAHEKRSEKVLLWRSALKEAGNHSGWDSRDRSESELVEEIAQVTLSRLYSISSNIGGEQHSNLVGIEEHVDKIVSMLCFDSLDVRVIGIWGMGGIGKTTLAKVVQKRFSSDFESCFFVDVGNEVRRLGLHHFVKKVFSRLLKDKDVDMNNPMTVALLQGTKVLVVLDNVDDQEQLESLVLASDAIKSQFGKRSRIILTSRNKKLLTGVADDIYKVESLYSDKALELFNRNAFKSNSSKSIDFKELSKKVVDYTGGNPLALTVLGSYLHSRSIKEWESALSELKKAPHERVQKVLRISFDALDRVKQSIFLDIGCILIEEPRETVEEILGEESHICINVLVENCLITINKNGEIGMHDLIQEMAWEIVRQEQVELGQRSRLWNTQDSYSVLRKNKGSAKNEVIFLDMGEMSKDLYLQPTVFEEMDNLRIIRIVDHSGKAYSIQFHQGLQHLPSSLRFLSWTNYPLKSLPSKFEPENLVRLDMSYSKLEKLWDGEVCLENLKYLIICFADYLIELPDLDRAPKLEHLNVSMCEKLPLHCIPKLNGNLKCVILRNSINLLPDRQSDLVSLETLVLTNVTKLKNLHLYSTNFESLPHLPSSLQHLDLKICKNLKSLPHLPSSLQHLDLRECNNLKSLPHLPSSLQHLDLGRCENLKSLPHLPSSLQHLYLDRCNNLKSLPHLPSSLQHLDLGGCNNLKSLPHLPSSLQHLYLDKCNNLKSLPHLPSSLQLLILAGCNNLKSLPHLPSSLQNLDLQECNNLKSLPHLPFSLKYLNLSGCNNLISLPRLPSSLQDIHLRGCKNLKSLLNLPSSLESLDVRDCMSLKVISARRCTSLKAIEATGCMLLMAFSIEEHGSHSWEELLKSPVESKLYCFGCLKLEQSGKKNSMIRFQRVLFGIATCLCFFYYHGNEIPNWIRHQQEGNSIVLTFPKHCYTLKGIVASLILKCKTVKSSCISCKLHLKTRCGITSDYRLPLTNVPKFFPEIDNPHVYMTYINASSLMKELKDDVVEAIFDFETECAQIQRCGIQLISLEEAEEFLENEVTLECFS